ncbi:MAG: rRNA maturation RNase YbeY [Cyclobacteriaceae bacterium]|nr:rRNA maturation RNase YbeY [Cyclobacteriaceae bacterium]
MGVIRYFSEGVSFEVPYPRKTAAWIKSVIRINKSELKEISFIFCSDDYLHTINKTFLNHTTLTDIITFDHSEKKGTLEGEIYISIDRVIENAQKFKVSTEDEIRRVMIHGVLHLLGYKDKKSSEKRQMRKKEEACLSLFK